MKIPKRVNAAWDWAERNIRILAIIIAAVIVAGSVMFVPVLASFVLGLVAGGLIVNQRKNKRLARQRSDVDNLLRENGALRHRNTVLASGVLTAESRMTQQIMIIPEDEPAGRATDDPNRTDDRSGRGERTAALSTLPLDGAAPGGSDQHGGMESAGSAGSANKADKANTASKADKSGGRATSGRRSTGDADAAARTDPREAPRDPVNGGRARRPGRATAAESRGGRNERADRTQKLPIVDDADPEGRPGR